MNFDEFRPLQIAVMDIILFLEKLIILHFLLPLLCSSLFLLVSILRSVC
jgi:hypothetical protein